MQKQQKRGRKEKKKERERERRRRRRRNGDASLPTQAAQDQAEARPRQPRDPGRQPLFLGFFFFLSLSNDLMNTYSLWFFVVYFAVVVVVFFIFFLDVNRILETRFLGKYHVKKVPHQTWITHENRIPKTQFIDPKSSLLNSRC